MVLRGKFRILIVTIGALLIIGSSDRTPNFRPQLFDGIKVRNFEFPHVADQILIKFKKVLTAKQEAAFLKRYSAKVMHHFRSGPSVVARVSGLSKTKTIREVAAQLALASEVEVVEANSILHADVIPNDARFNELYGMHNEGQTGGKVDSDIDAPEAWEISTGSKNVVVGIIDTGLNYLHPDLADNAWTNPGESGLDAQNQDKRTNGVDDDNNGYIDDWHGWDFVSNDNDPMDDNGYRHGSHVGGTIGARGNDGFGVAGVNWFVSLVGIKFLSASGSGSLDNAIKGIEYSNLINVNLTNNSWGGGGYSQIMADAIEVARQKEILFVASAGNEALNVDESPYYPGSYKHDNVISVAATDHNDNLAEFSNFGFDSVHLSAPGVDILSTSNDSDFKSLSGTSMAAPHVSGAVALIKAVFPELSMKDVKGRLVYGAEKIANLAGIVRSAGRLNVARSIENDTTAPSVVTAFTVKAAHRNSINFEWSESGDDGADGEASGYEIRYSSNPIVTEDQWEKALIGNLTIHGRHQSGLASGLIDGLKFNFRGYASIRAFDNVGNKSPIAAALPIEVKRINILYANDGSSMDGVSAQGNWGLQSLDVGAGEVSSVFTDSPNQWYLDNSDASIIFPPMSVASSDVTLVYSTATDLEKGYDFARVEVSLDQGQSWKEIDLLTGIKGWHMRQVDLTPILNGGLSFQIRFHIVTDYIIQAEGWFVDDVMVIKDE